MDNLQEMNIIFLKIISFLTLQIDQHKAETLIRIKDLDCLSTPFYQLSNILEILVGGEHKYALEL
jgi:hypothetical protein